MQRRTVREFAAAAAEFYRAKLWEVLDDTDLIKIETPRPPRLMKHAVVLGAGSQSYGLGLYQDDEDHYALMAQEADPRQMSLFSFVYESPADVVSEDVDLWKELDLAAGNRRGVSRRQPVFAGGDPPTDPQRN